MYLALFTGVIDRLISLVKRREEVNRATFKDFLTPAMASVEEVHKNYLTSFAEYREGIKDKKIRLNSEHPVFDSIKKDNIFSEQLRSKLNVLEPLLSDAKFGPFLTAIHNYLYGAAEPRLTFRTFPQVPAPLPELPPRPSQMVRSGYAKKLTDIVTDKEDEKIKAYFEKKYEKPGEKDALRRERALTALDDAVTELQNNYHTILEAYTALQKTLLKPK
jgi:hypothetical protein